MIVIQANLRKRHLVERTRAGGAAATPIAANRVISPTDLDFDHDLDGIDVGFRRARPTQGDAGSS